MSTQSYFPLTAYFLTTDEGSEYMETKSIEEHREILFDLNIPLYGHGLQTKDDYKSFLAKSVPLFGPPFVYLSSSSGPYDLLDIGPHPHLAPYPCYDGPTPRRLPLIPLGCIPELFGQLPKFFL